jgi:hypothetical protein
MAPPLEGAELARLAVAYAEGEERAGAREIGGNNAGDFVRKYMHGEPGPWCAAFFCWCWDEAARATAAELPVKYTRSVPVLWARMLLFGQAQRAAAAASSGLVVQPGDAAFFDWRQEGRLDHVSMVHHVEPDGTFYTIGGNEGSALSGAPVQVRRRGLLGQIPTLYGIGKMSPPL